MMEVTVYVEEEKRELIVDPEQWLSKVQELGLSGQEEIVADKPPNPFLRMDVELQRSLDALCPQHVDIKKFSAEPIPMQALSAYGLAVHEDYFGSVEIWYSPGHPDPVMVGKAGKEWYLMARWGPERVSLEDVKRLGRQRWIERTSAQLRKQLSEIKSNLDDMEGLATRHFAGEWTGLY